MRKVQDIVDRGIYKEGMSVVAGGTHPSIVEAHRHIEYVLEQGSGFIDMQESTSKSFLDDDGQPRSDLKTARYYRLMDWRTIGICLPRQLGVYLYLKMYGEPDDVFIVYDANVKTIMLQFDHPGLHDLNSRLSLDNIFCMGEISEFIRSGVPEKYKGKFKRAFLIQPAQLMDHIQAGYRGSDTAMRPLYEVLGDLCVENPYIVKVQ